MYFDNLVDKASEESGVIHLVRPTRSNKTDICYECEEHISAERIKALPGAERCLQCQQELERKGLGKVKAS